MKYGLPWKVDNKPFGDTSILNDSGWGIAICRHDLAKFIVEACNNYERLQAENKAWETNYTNLQAEYEEMASIAYSKSQELERLKNRIDKLSEELRTEQALRGE